MYAVVCLVLWLENMTRIILQPWLPSTSWYVAGMANLFDQKQYLGQFIPQNESSTFVLWDELFRTEENFIVDVEFQFHWFPMEPTLLNTFMMSPTLSSLSRGLKIEIKMGVSQTPFSAVMAPKTAKTNVLVLWAGPGGRPGVGAGAGAGAGSGSSSAAGL